MASLPEINNLNSFGDVKSEVQSVQCLSDETLPAEGIIGGDEIRDGAKDLLLKLEVEESYIEDDNDGKDDSDLQSGNEEDEPMTDCEQSGKVEQSDAPGYDIYKGITTEQREAARKNNECFICFKRFYRFSTFKRHMKRHTGVKNYKCHICSKAFAEGSYLKAHLITHSGATPYGCKICHKRFTQSSSLHSHIKIHTGEKRYKCEVCSKAFTESSTLRKHMLVHNPNPPQFQCNECGRSFSRKINLNEHMKTHYRNKGEPLDGDDLHFRRKNVFVHPMRC